MTAEKTCPRFARNRAGRDIAVGDIHGCFSHLSRALNSIGFKPTVDRLFSVGDLVDRGPQSAQVLGWLQKPWFYAVCGNHDLMALSAALGAASDVDYLLSWGAWIERLPKHDQLRLRAALAALPMALEIETRGGLVGLVHADCPFDDWHEMQKLSWSKSGRSGRLVDSCLWLSERYARRSEAPVKNVRAVVHGHTVVANPEVLGNAYFIETAGWRDGGRFTFLELATLNPLESPA